MKNTFGCTSRSILGFACAVGIAGLTSGAAADFQGPLVTLDYDWSGGGPSHFVMHQHSDKYWYKEDTNSWGFEGGAAGPQGENGSGTWTLGWTVEATDAPGAASSGASQFVNANLAITNLTGQAQTFSALVTLALPKSFTGGTVMDGSVAALVSDNDDAGATLTNANGNPIYSAFIDNGPPMGTPVQTLLDSVTLAAGPGSTASDDESFGFPNPVPGPEALNTISVFLEFELSAFDSANVVGTFRISQAVPAPGALPLLAGLALLGGRRRRA
jgi:hypothetical protein